MTRVRDYVSTSTSVRVIISFGGCVGCAVAADQLS